MTQTTSMAVLLIEDDERLAKFTSEYLEQNAVSVTWAHDGERGLAETARRGFDAVILDLMLPGRDGMSVCRSIRDKSDVPIVIITARLDESDKVIGLELGADDYVTKPYSPRELLARIRAVVRRHRGQIGPSTGELRVGRLRLQSGSRRALLDDQDLALTTYEFDLLYALAQRAGRVLSREQLIDIIRGSAEEAFDRSVDVHVSRLRQKLGDDGRNASILKTVRGVGYMLAEEASG